MEEQYIPTTPNTDLSDREIVRTLDEFSGALTLDMTDAEIEQAAKVMLPIYRRHKQKFLMKFAGLRSVEEAMALIDEMENEIQYEMATKCGILVRIDVEPLFEGSPPIIDWVGKVGGVESEFDHDQKEWEVKRATERDEAFLGQKGEANSARARRRNRNQ